MMQAIDVVVSVNRDHLRVNPGEAVDLTVTVHNDSNAIDVFRIEVSGIDDEWGRPDVFAQMLRPHPGRPEEPHRDCIFESRVTIMPPRNSTSVAGPRHLEIKGTRDHNPLQKTVVPVALDVLPFYSFELDLTPKICTGPRGAYTVSILNNGNHELNFELKARDPEELCTFTFDQPVPRVQPGETARIGMKVVPAQRPLRGRPRQYGFTATVTPRLAGLESREIHGTLNASSRWGGIMSRLNSALHRPRGTPSIRSFRLPTWVWLICGVAVITAVVVGIVYALRAGSDIGVAEFQLNPDQETRYLLPFPDSRTVRIEGSAQRQGTGGGLEVDLLRPDGSRSVLFKLLPSAFNLTFTIDEEVGSLGPDGWELILLNTSNSEQARGILKISTIKLE